MSEASVPARKPGLLGVCAAIADDFGGFNPEYLRVLVVLGMLWNAYYVAAGYLALAGVVAISRWLIPGNRKAPDRTPRLVAENGPAPTPADFEYAQAA